jgi:hypothetical protein
MRRNRGPRGHGRRRPLEWRAQGPTPPATAAVPNASTVGASNTMTPSSLAHPSHHRRLSSSSTAIPSATNRGRDRRLRTFALASSSSRGGSSRVGERHGARRVEHSRGLVPGPLGRSLIHRRIERFKRLAGRGNPPPRPSRAAETQSPVQEAHRPATRRAAERTHGIPASATATRERGQAAEAFRYRPLSLLRLLRRMSTTSVRPM